MLYYRSQGIGRFCNNADNLLLQKIVVKSNKLFLKDIEKIIRQFTDSFEKIISTGGI